MLNWHICDFVVAECADWSSRTL